MPLNLDRDERARHNQRVPSTLNAEERKDKATKANEKDSKAATTTTTATVTAAVTTPNEFMNMRHSGLWSSVSGLAGSFTSLSLSPPPHPSPGREHATGCHGNNGRKWRRSAQRAEHKHLIRPYLILVMPRNCCCSCSSLLSLLSFAFASRSLPHAVRLSLSLSLSHRGCFLALLSASARRCD